MISQLVHRKPAAALVASALLEQCIIGALARAGRGQRGTMLTERGDWGNRDVLEEGAPPPAGMHRRSNAGGTLATGG